MLPRHPDYNPVIKISAAVGELVADLVVHGRSNNPLVPEADFRLSCCAEDAPLLSPHPYLTAGQMR